MSNSTLATYIRKSDHKRSPRNHTIDTITIHVLVAQWTAKQGCDYFATTDKKCSANYVVGKDGSIGLSVDEADRSLCSSNAANDNRAVTIEVASDSKAPYAVTEAAYNALIALVADICKRNNIKELKWKADKSLVGKVDQQNMTVHRWFANKSCPGDYLYSRLGDIANRVNALISSDSPTPTENNVATTVDNLPACPFSVKVLVDNLNYRSKPSLIGKALGVTGKGVFTIVEVMDGWGRLKSGKGWIYIKNPKYCTIIKSGK